MTGESSTSTRKTKLFLQLLLVVGAALATIAATPGVRAASFNTADEATLRSMINQSRGQSGLSQLTHDSRAEGLARAQAARMAESGSLYHNPNLQADAKAAGLDAFYVGENVGKGKISAAEFHEGFMNSPAHHTNIVYPGHTLIGVGVVVNPDGTRYVAEVFVTPNAAPAPAPKAAEPAPAESSTPAPVVQVAGSTQEATEQDPVAVEPTPAPESNSPYPNAIIGGVVDGA